MWKLIQKKIKASINWPTLTTLQDEQSFQGLATSYHRFIKGFSTIMAPITDCMKKGQISWGRAAKKAFNGTKKYMTEAAVLWLSDFTKVLEVACEASHVGIGLALPGGAPNCFF